MSDRGLTHLDPLGRARMVDVTPKEQTHRRAIARGRVHMSTETTSLVARGAIIKGDVLSVARVAGIQAAKRAADLIPLCHPVMVGAMLVNFRTTDVTGEVILPEGTEMVMPGDNVALSVKLIAPIAMDEGLRFAIREGGRTVGSGVVSKITK